MSAAIVSKRTMIGMEIHVELATKTKMFSRTPNVAHPDWYDAPPNSLCDPVCLGLPGALPTMNRRAVEMSMLVGLALGCRIPDQCSWDRKNYFYPDLPKGYQISQFQNPLCAQGAIELPLSSGELDTIRITRAHLEEDTGKTGHELPGGKPAAGSIIDYNRSGTPLLEIVTEPDFTCADDAVIFCRELRAICRALGVTEGIMQRGHMRFEPNINVVLTLEDGREVATPIVEVKNLNSFRAVQGAIEYEERRQVEQWLGRSTQPNAASEIKRRRPRLSVLSRTRSRSAGSGFCVAGADSQPTSRAPPPSAEPVCGGVGPFGQGCRGADGST
jgi:aspartyl-tRNA(Asn)/glutamyl-tRNA(Gln) amidotransferase subunit B